MASSAPSVVKKGSANARAAAATAATAPELARARAGASFDVDQMRYLLHYGKANTEREEAIRSKVRDGISNHRLIVARAACHLTHIAPVQILCTARRGSTA